MKSFAAAIGDLAERHRASLFWLAACLVIFSGIGLRGPWPGDEPRFVQIAREMVSSGHWFFPTRGGELYSDKPPIFMWTMALFFHAIGSIKWAFLLPSAFSALLTLYLVKDLGQRLWNRRTGYIAASMLLLTLQFVLRAKSAQIDAMACAWIMLGCYGLLRHLLTPPQWRWYYLAWFFMGIGIITKGVGFLPALMLIPYALARRFYPVSQEIWGGWRWWLGPACMLAATALWLLPMLVQVAQAADPAFVHYRNDILFHQTGKRYAGAWHHIHPFGFYFTSVIPIQWLPLSLATPWLLRHWIDSCKTGDRRIILPLGWVLLVLAFFSISKGKRDVYILPALPMLALLSAPYFDYLRKSVWLGRLLLGLVTAFTAGLLCVGMMGIGGHPVTSSILEYASPALGWLAIAAGMVGGLAAWIGRREKWLSWAIITPGIWLFYCFWGYPLLQPSMTVKPLFNNVARHVPIDAELVFINPKEQLLLESPYPVTHFANAEAQQIGAAWRWLDKPEKFVLLSTNSNPTAALCFDVDKAIDLGQIARKQWGLLPQSTRLSHCPLDAQQAREYRFAP